MDEHLLGIVHRVGKRCVDSAMTKAWVSWHQSVGVITKKEYFAINAAKGVPALGHVSPVIVLLTYQELPLDGCSAGCVEEHSRSSPQHGVSRDHPQDGKAAKSLTLR